MYDVKVEDQDHTVDLLKSGGVHALITTEPKAQSNCRVVSLGTLRYRAVCTPRFFEQYFSQGINENSFAQAPMLMFNQKDQLQHQFMQKFTSAKLNPPTHYLPSVHAFVHAPLLDMGWCMSVSPLCQKYLDNGLLRDIATDVYLDVPLYWQYSTLPTKWLQQLTHYIEQQAITSHGLISSA